MAELRGLTQVYTGAGKGKTTAAFGLALRAAGQGLTVRIIQFMKAEPPEPGEVKSLQSFAAVKVDRFGGRYANADQNNVDDLRRALQEGLSLAQRVLAGASCDVLILDEVNVAVSLGLVEVRQVLELVDIKPDSMELILTGRHAPSEIIESADLVTEMVEVKHPFKKGVAARKGIEF